MDRIRSFIKFVGYTYSAGAFLIPICLVTTVFVDKPRFDKNTPRDIGFCFLVSLGYGICWPVLLYQKITDIS